MGAIKLFSTFVVVLLFLALLEAYPIDVLNRARAESDRSDKPIEPRDILMLAKKIIELLLTLQRDRDDNKS